MFPKDNENIGDTSSPSWQQTQNTPVQTPDSPIPEPVNYSAGQAQSQLYEQAQNNQAPQVQSIGYFGDKASVPYQPIQPTKKSKRKLFIFSGIASFLIIASTLGYVFGLYVPSQPENVYSTAMNRSGKGLEKVITQVTAKSELDRFKKGEYTGKINANFSPTLINGTASLKYDESKVDAKVDVTSTTDGQNQENYKAQFLAEIKDGESYPDIYFVIQGLNSLGLDAFAPELLKLDGTWIKIESNYIKELYESYSSALNTGGDTDATNETPELTSADVEELGKITSGLITEFVLTSDESKSIFVNRSFIEKEKIDGMNTYHYKVGINPDNYVKACIESANRYLDSSAVKRLAQLDEQTVKESKDLAKKACEDQKRDIDDKLDFDMWVDAKYKLIYKIRIVDPENEEQPFEFGQKYKGGDDLHFFATYEELGTPIKFTMTSDINIKTLVSSTKFDLVGEDDMKFNMNIDGKPLEGEITIDKPANPKLLQDILKELGFSEGGDVLDPLGVDPMDELLLDPGI